MDCASLQVHLRGKRHTAALTALLAADPGASVPGLSFRLPALSAAPSPAASVASQTAASSVQDTGGSIAAAASAGAVTAYDASWQPPSGTQYACRICQFASNSNDALQHFKVCCGPLSSSQVVHISLVQLYVHTEQKQHAGPAARPAACTY